MLLIGLHAFRDLLIAPWANPNGQAILPRNHFLKMQENLVRLEGE